MASEVENLIVRLTGDATSFTRMIGVTAPAATKKGAGQIEARLRLLANRITFISGAIAAGIGVVAVKAFADFNQAMTESTSIMKVTAEQTREMRDTALELSKTAVQGPTELAESYFFLASAGKSAAQSMALLPALSKFATAGAFDMATATDLLTDAQSALGLSSKVVATDTKNLIALGDVLVKANTLSNATVQQFSESLTNTAAASLKSFGKGMEEGIALLAAYADQGIKGAVAGTNLSRVMLLLSKSARENAKAHRELGFDVFNASGEMRNFADIIENLEEITGEMTAETKSATLAQLGFAARVQQAILPLIGTSNAIREYESQLNRAGGTTARVAEKQMKSFSNQMKILKNQISAAAIEIGENLSGSVLGVARGLTTMLTSVAPLITSFIALTAAVVTFNVALKVSTAIGIPAMIKGLLALQTRSIAAMIAVRGLFAVVTGALAFGVTRGIAEAFEFDLGPLQSVAAFNRELEKSKIILESIAPRAGGGSPIEQFERAKVNILGMAAAVKNAERNVEELNTGWRKLGFQKQLLVQANAELDDANARLKLQKQLVDELAIAEKEFREARAIKDATTAIETGTIGFGLFGIAVEAAAKEGLAQIEAMKKGIQVTEEFLTPLQRLEKEQEFLGNLFDRNAISLETYDRALEKIAGDYEKATKESEKFKRSLGIRDVAIAGSAEALARSNEFQSRRAEQRRVAAATGASTEQNKQGQTLAAARITAIGITAIKGLMEQLVEKEPIEVAEANL